MMMTARTGFQLLSALAVAVSLTIPAMPAHAEDPPPGDVEGAISRAQTLIQQGDSRGGCKEYLRASELSQGKSVASWIGLSHCEKELGSFDKAVDMARKARAVASTPQERSKATTTLACALLVKADAQANAEALNLLKEEMATPEGNYAQKAYFQALLELRKDREAADFFPSLKDEVRLLPCLIADQKQADDLNERLHAIAPDLDILPVKAELKRPEIIHQVNPVISGEARSHPGFSGQVVVEASIDRQGRVQKVRVLKGQPYGLSESAVASVKQWRFKPGTANGRPIRMDYTLTVNFQITK
jgi:protein TonB